MFSILIALPKYCTTFFQLSYHPCYILGRNITKGATKYCLLSHEEMKKRGYVVSNKKLARIFKGSLNKQEYLKAYEGYWPAIDTSIYLPWLMDQLRSLTDK